MYNNFFTAWKSFYVIAFLAVCLNSYAVNYSYTIFNRQNNSFISRVSFNSDSLNLKTGEQTTISLNVDSVENLFSCAGEILFDKSGIIIIQVTEGNLLNFDNAGTSFLYKTDTTIGKITFGITRLGAGNGSVTKGYSKIIEIKLKKTKEGPASVYTQNLQFFDLTGQNIDQLNQPVITINSFYQVTCNLVYDNSSLIPVKNVTVYLKNQNQVVDSAVPGIDGSITFPSVPNGNYSLAPVCRLPWGGVNSSDALEAMRHYAGISVLTDLKLTAADVNCSGKINSTDALDIMRRFTGLKTSFAAGDWVFNNSDLAVYNNNTQNIIKTLCTGDVNASYLAGPAKSYASITFKKTGIKNPAVNLNVEIPIKIENDIETNAVSMVIYFPAKGLSFSGIDTKLENTVFNVNGNKISIAWSSLDAAEFKKGETVFVLKFITGETSCLLNELELDTESEFADVNGKILNGINLVCPAVNTTLPSEFCLRQNYPNPFNPSTMLRYSLPVESNVQLVVYNSLGQKVSSLVNERKNAGSYEVLLDGSLLSSGVYLYSININPVDGSSGYYSVKKAVCLK